MKEVGVAQIKAELSQYLARVKRGEEVIVTQHGQPIAKLVPYRSTGSQAKARAALVQQGILTLGNSRLHPSLLRSSPVQDPTGDLLRCLLAEREET